MSSATSAGANYTIPPNVKNSGSNSNHGAATRVGSNTSLFDNVTVGRTQNEVFGSTVIDGTDTNKALSGGPIAYNNSKPVAVRYSTTIAGVSNTVLRSGADVPGQIRGINKREAYKVSKIATAYRNGYWDPFMGKFSVYGTYSRTAYTVTVVAAHHGLVNDDYVKLDFTSGAATDGYFAITRVDANSFTVTHTATGSTTGNVTVLGSAYNTESPGTDNAASPTRAAPGDLVFKLGQYVPVRNRDYSAKTG